MTGHALDADSDTFRVEGFRDAVFKPFPIKNLSRVVRAILDSGP